MSSEVSGRLKRLIESGICPAEDASEYADELRLLAEVDSTTLKRRRNFFKALADETRLRIIKLLGIREMCVCEIMVALNLTQPTASHHLGILENAEIITHRKEGRWVFYNLSNPELAENISKACLL